MLVSLGKYRDAKICSPLVVVSSPTSQARVAEQPVVGSGVNQTANLMYLPITLTADSTHGWGKVEAWSRNTEHSPG